MASGNGNEGVLRRMVKLVSSGSAARDTSVLPADAGASQFADVEKAELKAMIERKRRNDFVRKRELDMLRRIRREGLTPEQAASLSASSRLDDSEVRQSQPAGVDRGVKAKIDAIEKQMVGHTGSAASRMPRGVAPPTLTSAVDAQATLPMAMDGVGLIGATRPMVMLPELDMPGLAPATPADAATPDVAAAPVTVAPAAPVAISARPSAPPATRVPASLASATVAPMAMEVSEVVHDQELDEAVIAFANADFALCERALVQLTSPNGLRHGHNETWLVLFDLFRATGQQDSFDILATDYLQRFQRSAPQWFSLPRLVAEASTPTQATPRGTGDVAWICPARLDTDGVAQMNSQTLQLPQPWVLDWTHLQHIDPDAAARLYRLMQGWARQVMEMRWIASDRLFAVLQDAAPVGVRDADPAYWMSRLEVLRLINRPDQFDEVAIDYCVTYEVSPPSWEPTRCAVRIGGGHLSTQSAPLSVLSEATTTMQGGATEAGSGYAVTSLELSGQLSGDLGQLLSMLDNRLGDAKIVRISCALLIRVDFIAAGDLLNWVIAKKAESRRVSFTDVHRLVALMFGAMGISEHTAVHLRQA
jgi:ABC-type transporter Mla MlaB component